MIEFKLAEVLEEVKLNMNKLAVLADVRPNTISDLANGKTKRIELETLDKILYAINQTSLMRSMGRFYQIQDIIQFSGENNEFLLLQQEPLMTYEVFLKIKKILRGEIIFATIGDLSELTLLDFIQIYEDYLRNGVASHASGDHKTKRINKIFLDAEYTLNSLGLIQRKNGLAEAYVFSLSKKGDYFFKLLKSDKH
ncbi:helix-turn-helix transcriptional regulator [Paenibacillus sp. CMAA1739]|uniref:helix-turn-helix domain-containing protein n=1 Tax=Paenibacillus ottowii TaxID=2315729 RepID=UPI002DBC0FFB|nr:helix-turn-helix transcriptional regulator [Paenibacillus sp. CMAA1739]MEC4565298.1 helix-turn-helix transcriptional regulator [Paenibacillus sp. CMAA1739]